MTYIQKALNELALSPTQRQALQSAKERIGQRFPVRSFILFGSYARGEATPDSDIDLFVLTEQKLSWQERFEITHILSDVNLEYDTLIHSVVTPVEKWDSPVWSLLPISEDIRTQGVAV
jgi:predicted nucleotidyltransferase